MLFITYTLFINFNCMFLFFEKCVLLLSIGKVCVVYMVYV